jgi:phosphoribosylformylglycinamidine synthase subunit PurL
VREAVRRGTLASAHDVADGGLACALAESCIGGGIGASVDLAPLAAALGDDAADMLLFGEGPGGVVVSGPGDAIDALPAELRPLVLGEVGGKVLAVTAGVASLAVPVEVALAAHEGGVPGHFA